MHEDEDIKEYYKYVTDKNNNWECIGITKGRWHGVIYRYGQVKFIEDEDKDELTLSFEWDIIDSNGFRRDHFNDDFFNFIGDILHDIINEQVEEGILEYVDADD
jgi:hypothetical protein